MISYGAQELKFYGFGLRKSLRLDDLLGLKLTEGFLGLFTEVQSMLLAALDCLRWFSSESSKIES